MRFLAQWRLIILENHGWNQSPQLIKLAQRGLCLLTWVATRMSIVSLGVLPQLTGE